MPIPNRKIKNIPIGAINLRHKMINENVLTPILPLFVRVSLSLERFNIHPANIEISMPPRGKSIFEDVKSKKLKKSIRHNPKKLLLLK